MLEILLIIIAIGLLYFGYVNVKKNSGFDLKENEVYFQQNKKLIPYLNIISIERDMTNSYKIGTTLYIAYIITFYNEQKNEDSFRFYKAMTHASKWNLLKSRVTNANPFAKINESIL